jgi:hypothetical protein
MHYMTHRSHRMQKHKFGVTCSSTLFMKTAPGPPEHEKECVDVLHPGRTRMHYTTLKSRWRQKHKFGVTSPEAIFVDFVPVPSKHEK